MINEDLLKEYLLYDLSPKKSDIALTNKDQITELEFSLGNSYIDYSFKT